MSTATQLKRTLTDTERFLAAERAEHERTRAEAGRLARMVARFPGRCQLCGFPARGPLCAAHSDLAGHPLLDSAA